MTYSSSIAFDQIQFELDIHIHTLWGCVDPKRHFVQTATYKEASYLLFLS